MRQFDLVVPAYNEGPTAEQLIDRAKAAAESAGYDHQAFQLIVVNNGSTDDTHQHLAALAQGPLAAWFQVVTVPQNRGYGHGLWAGLQTTQAKYVGWTHADMQCDPADAFRALQIARTRRRTLVKGVRDGRAVADIAVSRTFEGLARLLLGLDAYEINAQPKVMERELLTCFRDPPTSFAFDLYALYQAQKAGYGFKSVDVRFPPRIHGVSKWAASFAGRYRTILAMVRYMLQLRQEEGVL
jgi:glycosyltransferase involved in cell wall biosynthesis